MAGTKLGGKLAATKNLAKDPDFYKKIGRIGGKKGNTGGFAARPELAREAGAKGGKVSRRYPIQQYGETDAIYEARLKKYRQNHPRTIV